MNVGPKRRSRHFATIFATLRMLSMSCYYLIDIKKNFSGEMFAKLNRKSRCCDPFGCHKTTITKGIRNVTDKAKFHFPYLTDDDKLCTKCRKQVADLPMTQQARSREVETSESDSDCGRNDGDVSELVIPPDTFVSPDLSLLNSTLSAMGESPVVKKKAVRSHQYVAEKAKKIEVAVKRQL